MFQNGVTVQIHRILNLKLWFTFLTISKQIGFSVSWEEHFWGGLPILHMPETKSVIAKKQKRIETELPEAILREEGSTDTITNKNMLLWKI
ncbi:hypothetical protein AMQ68_18090 [Chryseobacterium sp. ERMR1:04]|nr:hypothetical protein AMQ68_18090 [Chryseobacterium sp. ERMR1:04]